MPVSDSNPDFRGPNASKIAWTTHVLTIDRKLMDNGRPVGLGMIVRQTEASCGCFEHIITGNTKLFDIYSKDFENEYPFALDPDFQGCVVTAITENSPASNAGVNLGDVLVRVRLLSFVDGFEPPEQRDYKLKDEDKQQRVSLFKLPCTKFEVTVKRPSSNLLDSATKWVNELREYNRASSMELLERRLFVCKSCQAEQLNLENEDAATKILKEARYCRSILRRISLESYSRKFHLEEALVDKTFEGVPSLHQMYVSLSRLDSMMEYIILSAEDLARTEQISGAADKKLLRRSFYLPEWTGRNEERLAWAPEHLEKQPGELLCRGVFFLCRSHSNDQENASGGSGSPTREEKYMLFEHFVDLFCSWYLAPLQCVATGPPEAKLTYRRPWIGKICCVCRVRTGTIKEGHRVVCSSDACREILEPSVELTPRRRDKISIYEECSGLVGSTVLLFPGKDDHWLIQLTQKFGFKHNNMPVEYICAGYIPPLSDNCVEDEGEFFLLPIMNERLLQYLLEKQCLPMVRPTKFSQESIWVDWIESSILSVWGMIRVSLTEMRLKVEETCLFLNKIHEDIAARACGRRDSEVIDPLAKDDKLVFISCLSCPSAYCPAVEKSAKDRSAFLHGNAKQVSVLTEILDRQPSRQYRSMVELSEDSREMSRVVGAVDRRELDEISEDDSRLIRVEKSKEGLDRDPEGSSRLQLTAENLCIPPRAGEQLLYTDLYGTSIEEKRLLEDLLPSLPQPALRDAFKYDRETIVLSFRWPSASSSLAKRVPEYSGIGWGFELLKWSEERTLRVGRVHPYSPAAACGLEPNDILLSINGRSTGRGTIWTGASLVAAVLGAPLLVDSPYRRRAMDNIAAMLAYIGSKCERVKGPLILEVARLQQVNHAAEDRYARSNQLQNTEKEVDVVCETLRQGQNNSLASLSDTSNIEGKSSANRTGNNCLEPIQATATECPSKPSLQRTNKNTQASPVLEPGNNEDDEVQILGTQQMIPPPRGDADRKIAVLNAVQVLAAEVSSTLSRRPSITPSGLYRSVEIGKITLTQFECAVYLEAIHAQMYNIGLR